MSRYRVLLIDDDYFPDVAPEDGNFMQHYVDGLGEIGCQIESAKNWDEARKIIDGEKLEAGGVKSPQKSFDLIILDLSMPRGKSFTREQTNGGLTTGIAVSKELTKRRLRHVILSNMLGGPIPDDFGGGDSFLIKAFLKPDCTPDFFRDQIKCILADHPQ